MQENTDIKFSVEIPAIKKEEFAKQINELNANSNNDKMYYNIYNTEFGEVYDGVFEHRQEYINYLNEQFGYNYTELPLIDKRKWGDRFFEDEKQKVVICFSHYSPIHKKFSELHVELVNRILLFCKENNLRIEHFNLSGDGCGESIKYGSWTPFTDSSFALFDKNKESILCSM